MPRAALDKELPAESAPTPLLSAGEAIPAVLCSDLGFSIGERHGDMEEVLQRAAEMINDLEHLFCEKRLRELSLCSLERRRLSSMVTNTRGMVHRTLRQALLGAVSSQFRRAQILSLQV